MPASRPLTTGTFSRRRLPAALRPDRVARLAAPAGLALLAGGGDAAMNAFTHESDGGWAHPPLVSKMRGIRLHRGEAVRLETPGGGGYGDARERDPRAVADDVHRGLVGEAEADALHGDRWRSVAVS